MVVLGVLIASLLIFRALGASGISVFTSWRASARDALAVMLLFAASAHFTRMKEDLFQMMPPWVPWPRATVYFTGFCEIAAAVGLVIPRLRQIAGACLIAFFVAILPANIHAAKTGVRLRGKPATALLVRIPMQLLFIAWTWWCAIYP